jgi:hypothetical protein
MDQGYFPKITDFTLLHPIKHKGNESSGEVEKLSIIAGQMLTAVEAD